MVEPQRSLGMQNTEVKEISEFFDEDYKSEEEAEQELEMQLEADEIEEVELLDEEDTRKVLKSCGSALSYYLHKIGQYPLMTQDEEIAAFKRLEESTDETEKQAIKEEILIRNLRLSVSIAKKFCNAGNPLEDCIQNGNLGMMKAIEKFEYRKGWKFSTYATWWIRQNITRENANTGSLIRKPCHAIDMLNRIKKVTIELTAELGREPRREEIAEACKISVKQLENYAEIAESTFSLDYTIATSDKSDGELTLMDTVEDKSESSDVASNLSREEMKEAVREALKCLDERELRIIIERNGFDGGKSRTLDEVGIMENLTRERVRQIEKVAKKKIYDNFGEKLRPFLDTI